MAIITNEIPAKELVQLEIKLDKLAILFESGLICAAEIRCLTAMSKQRVSDLCLSSCAKKISCNIALFNEFSTTQAIHFKAVIKSK
ncbi:MAG: hypothetical protein V5786_03520 [Psychromonas sp.]